MLLLTKRLNAKGLNKEIKKHIKNFLLANKSNGHIFTSKNKKLNVCNIMLALNNDDKDNHIKNIKKLVSYSIYKTFNCSMSLEYIKNNKKVNISDFINENELEIHKIDTYGLFLKDGEIKKYSYGVSYYGK